MKVCLDTNVLISAFATRGLCADVVRLVLAGHELVVAEVVLEEVQRVLKKKFDLPQQTVREIVAFLKEHTVQPAPKVTTAPHVRDLDDQWVLESALAAKADVLVTGDKDLLDVKSKVSGLVITDPRGFWDMLRKQTKEEKDV